MKVGIIGLPMSGKSSLFRLLTNAEVSPTGSHGNKAEQRQTSVQDPRLDRLTADYTPKKTTHATIDFLDFPAIVKPGGGERKSCADLLAPAREAGALILVIRNFENAAAPPIRGELDAQAELAEMIDELKYADLDTASNRLERIRASIHRKRGDDRKQLDAELEVLEKVVATLEADGEVRDIELNAEQTKLIRGFQFLSQKPRLILENLSEGREAEIPESIPMMVAIELELQDLDEESREMFAEEYGLTDPAKERVIQRVYQTAGLISFLTAGEQEVRAWTIAKDTRAQDAAGAIHTDIQRGFIRAEVTAFADYAEHGGIHGAKEKGLHRLEGKDYLVKDGDIIEFRFSV